jgi:hypothetical protein
VLHGLPFYTLELTEKELRMLRFLAQTALLLLANALALLVSSILLTGFTIKGLAFLVAVSALATACAFAPGKKRRQDG